MKLILQTIGSHWISPKQFNFLIQFSSDKSHWKIGKKRRIISNNDNNSNNNNNESIFEEKLIGPSKNEFLNQFYKSK